MRIVLRLFFLGCAVPLLAGAADPDGAEYWRDVQEPAIGVRAEARLIIPDRYRTLALDLDGLRTRLAAAPLELTAAAAATPHVLAFPTPGGKLERFAVVESPVMEPGLSAKFPLIRSYRGQGVDDPTATARFDLTETGFHAQVIGAGRYDYIDPYAAGDRVHYISYRRSDHSRTASEDRPFRCELLGPEPDRAKAGPGTAQVPPVGGKLRTYRLAVAATAEYTAAVCSPNPAAVPCGISAVVTSINRVNGIYERELAVRLVLVANDDLVVYSNTFTDPYTNGSGGVMLSENQSNLDSVIGPANYDVGHVFSTGGGGVAALGVVCSSGNKAKGVTGRPIPVGDAFDVDYVAHELGHQFGALHSFNGTSSACGGGNRTGSSAYEPGSGSTIMAYAGICAAENLQPNSDPYFHTRSFDEITGFLASGGDACDVETATGNTAPSVSAGSNFTIPTSTPFTLTATASDAEGDALTYGWEEFDLGGAAPPNEDSVGPRPIFRSFNPTASPSRTFPKLADVLAGSFGTSFESLPSITRTMTFRVTARDNRAGGGGVNWASTQLSVVSTAGPFTITAPNTAVTWPALSTQTVTWNVAGTAAAPVNAANVAIQLSTDGGATFPLTLAASVPNSGSTDVTMPDVFTITARVRVQAVDNVFFDISNANFTISGGPTVAETSPEGSFRLEKGAGAAVTATYTPACGAVDHAIFRGIGPIAGALSWRSAYCALGAGGSASFNPGTPASGQFFYFTIVGQDGASEGSYGRNSLGAERPEAVGVGSCNRPLVLGGSCP